MAIYLGFDASTQSLTAVAIDVTGASRRVVFARTLTFDETLPGYGTRAGVLPSEDPLVATAPPLMWAEALDRMMGLLADSGLDVARVRAVSGSAQQHGSVYLTPEAAGVLAALDPGRPLVEQIGGIFARPDAPIWMDASTATECGEITEAAGGAERLARLSGSRAFERFTGPQIRRFARRDPERWARTDRVHLVSSFLASLLTGRHAPTEPGDGAGTNLMDIGTGTWAPALLDATVGDLERRLPALVSPWTIAGPLARYWRDRYRLPAARVAVWTGDNPSSLIGTGGVREGSLTVSLGTSDTLFGLVRSPRPDPDGSGHVFGAPTGDWMSLVCCRNGSLARERVRDEFGLDWGGFSRCLQATAPGNGGAVMLPWFEPEITPPVRERGVHRYGLDPADAAANVRAVVEAQMTALAVHSRWMGVTPDRICATGGAAANPEILQVLADVLGADVVRLEIPNAACLGAALRAYHADHMADGVAVPWEDVIAGFVEPGPDALVRPIPGHRAVYRRLETLYRACEAHALGGGPPPDAAIAAFQSPRPP